MSFKQQDKSYLNMAGEFLVAGELNRRKILASVTYGASKAADVFAFRTDPIPAVKIEVKTTDKKKWPVGSKAFDQSLWRDDIFWILVLLPTPLNKAPEDDSERGRFGARFFVLSSEELGRLAKYADTKYKNNYFKRHGKKYISRGVPNLTIDSVLSHEGRFDKIIKQLIK
jgi:hypothetical protein